MARAFVHTWVVVFDYCCWMTRDSICQKKMAGGNLVAVKGSLSASQRSSVDSN